MIAIAGAKKRLTRRLAAASLATQPPETYRDGDGGVMDYVAEEIVQ